VKTLESFKCKLLREKTIFSITKSSKLFQFPLHFSSNSIQFFILVGSLTHLESGATPLLGSHEALEGEIKRLRERLHTVESENFSLNAKLAQQHWEVEHRLAEIEMQICGASSNGSESSQENEAEDTERNRESII
jgi:hypothetical protein